MLKRHPEVVGRVALASLEGQDQTIKSPANVDAFLNRVDAVLGQDAAARAAVPNLPALMRRVHERLDAAPAAITVSTDVGPVELKLGALGVQLLAAGMVANPPSLIHLPALYLALDAGRTEVVRRSQVQVRRPDPRLGSAGSIPQEDLASPAWLR